MIVIYKDRFRRGARPLMLLYIHEKKKNKIKNINKIKYWELETDKVKFPGKDSTTRKHLVYDG